MVKPGLSIGERYARAEARERAARPRSFLRRAWDWLNAPTPTVADLVLAAQALEGGRYAVLPEGLKLAPREDAGGVVRVILGDAPYRVAVGQINAGSTLVLPKGCEAFIVHKGAVARLHGCSEPKTEDHGHWNAVEDFRRMEIR